MYYKVKYYDYWLPQNRLELIVIAKDERQAYNVATTQLQAIHGTGIVISKVTKMNTGSNDSNNNGEVLL